MPCELPRFHLPSPACSETTSSSCFTYGLAYGINAGILPAADFTPVVAAAWAGLTSIALQPNGLVGWCQPPGGGPGPAEQNSTSDFCVGQFLLAGSEVLTLAQQ
jgi:unsaturated rhamnogalacturonyl hydrolase